MATFLDAAIEVLRGSDRPMTAREITQAGIEAGLLSSTSKTPEGRMSAALYEDANREPAGQVGRIAVEGNRRAVRGSVRWVLNK